MRKWIGILCIFLGIACLISAGGFVVYNRWEEQQAEQVAQDLLADVHSIIDSPKPEPPLPNPTEPENPPATEILPTDPTQTPTVPQTTPTEPVEPETIPAQMPTIKVNGYDCIGILSIPVLNLELPVLTQWSYTKLKKAPCHYYGSYFEENFVIAAHNYASHFGRLSQLQAGDLVIFTDVTGTDHYYAVVLCETLPKEATREMITSGFGLSLYTCTPGGANRVTVRCEAIRR